MKRKKNSAFLLLLIVKVSSAQSFKLMRYDDEYRRFKDTARTLYTNLKYIPLNRDGNVNLSFGGEIRLELDRATNEDWGAANTGTDLFFLQRYNLHANLQIGTRVRFFGQLRSGLEFGRRNGPRPIDEDQLNVQNLFLDIIPFQDRDKSLTLRIGRQEIQYGSGRLIDVREGPNLRQYFDGAKMAYASSKWSVDVFHLGNAGVKKGVFDNPLGKKTSLWGAYTTRRFSSGNGLDLYYLGINRDQAKFDEGVADEVRHTIGARFFRNSTGLSYNFEFGYQFGSFASGSIRSWGGSSEIGYRYDEIRSAPTLKLRADFVSGDKNKGDGKLNTFNAMYPNGGYFGMNPQAGPANIRSLHPSVAWNLARKFLLTHEIVLYWRHSLEDGIYRPDGGFNLSSSGSLQRYIGTAYITTANWKIDDKLNLTLGMQYFQTGKFIHDVIPQHKNGLFMTSLLAFKF